MSENGVPENRTHVDGFEVSLELEVVAGIVSDQTIDVLLGHAAVDGQGGLRRGAVGRVSPRREGIGVRERVKGVVPPDVVGVRVHPDFILETAGGDLVVVLGVAPATNTMRRAVEEGRVVHVGGV